MLIILLRLLNSLQILHFIFNNNAQDNEVIIVHRTDFSSCPSFSWDHGTHGKTILVSWQGELGLSSIYTNPRKAKSLSQHLHGERPAVTEVCSLSMQISVHRVPSWTCGTTQSSLSDPKLITKPFCKDGGREKEKKREEKGEGGRRKKENMFFSLYCFLLFSFCTFPPSKAMYYT